MNLETSHRLSSFQTGIFNELAQHKKNAEDKGQQVIDLSIGSPDQSPPPFIIDSLVKHVQDPSLYGYSLTGTGEFHEAVTHYYRQKFGVTLDQDNEVLMLMGSQDGLVHLPLAYVNPGDVMLVPDPGYIAYEAGVHLTSAKPYFMPLVKENRFLPDLKAIPEQVARQVKMLFLNFPGNPVPAVADRPFFEEVVQFAKTYNLLVVHDFAYSDLIFDGKKAMSFLEVEGAKDVGVEMNSLSKNFNMAGCRIGFLAGNAKVIQALSRLKTNLDYGVFLPIQKAAVAALRDDSGFLKQNAMVYEKRRNILVEGLAQYGWHVDRPPATMFVWAAVPEGWTSSKFAFELIDKAGVLVTPGDAFGKYGEGYVRIAFVQEEETIRQAVERIGASGVLNNKHG